MSDDKKSRPAVGTVIHVLTVAMVVEEQGYSLLVEPSETLPTAHVRSVSLQALVQLDAMVERARAGKAPLVESVDATALNNLPKPRIVK